jgi:hypothetical protein
MAILTVLVQSNARKQKYKLIELLPIMQLSPRGFYICNTYKGKLQFKIQILTLSS